MPSTRRSSRPTLGLAAATAAAALALIAYPSAAAAGRPCPLPAFGPGADYHPTIHPADFTAQVTNPYFPLTPGRISLYTGVKDHARALDIFAPSHRTALIDGVRTRVVRDRLYLNGHLAERTADYYAQDRCGNVWYFGEDTAELDRRGDVTTRAGSFHAGAGPAQPGVFMQANPQPKRRFRQEWSPGQAEDTYAAIDLSTPATVPYGHVRQALRTEETTALEPGVVDNKLYARGIGELLETAVKGPRETLRLTEIIT